MLGVCLACVLSIQPPPTTRSPKVSPGHESKTLAKDPKRYTNSIKITGDFQQFVKFLNFIERHESFLQVTSFALSPLGDLEKADTLAADIQISTFRYNAPK